MAHPENLWIELCEEFFSLLAWLRVQENWGAFETVRQKILDRLAGIEGESRRRGLPPDDWREVKFALTALVDETIMSSAWPEKGGWEKRMLQDEYFDTTNAGEEFFDRLEQLRRIEIKKPELVEVYYWCLLLGFEGKYGSRQELQPLRADLKNELGLAAHSLSQPLSPRAVDAARVSAPLPRPAPARSWLPAGIVWAACLSGALIYFTILENRLGAAAEEVKTQLEHRLK